MKRLLTFATVICVLFSSQGHAQWVQTNGPYGGDVRAFAVVGSNLFAGTAGCGVFLSSNNGGDWTAVNTGLTDAGVNALVVSGTNLFAGANGGVFLWNDSGSSWTAVRTGLPNNYVYALAFSGSNLFAGTLGSGVWRRPLSEMITAVKEIKSALPAQFSLEQNFPNPFNPSTVIEFSLPRSSYVTLKVFSLLGEEVATLTGQDFTAGSYRVDWNAKGVASGVYLYRLIAGSFVETKKILLVR